jgi:hypothetical protein
MRTRVLIAIVVVMLGGLLLAQIALAMTSTNYRLDWFTPLTTNGGGRATSANYAINLTIGQTVRGASNSASYQAGLGYWYGVGILHRILLPLIMK